MELCGPEDEDVPNFGYTNYTFGRIVIGFNPLVGFVYNEEKYHRVRI